MTVIDARVLCVRPTLSNIAIDLGTDDPSSMDRPIYQSKFTPSLRAQYNWKNTHPDIVDHNGSLSPINCTLPDLSDITDSNWAISLCAYINTTDSKNPTFNDAAGLRNGIRPDTDDPDSSLGHTFVYILLRVVEGDWSNFSQNNNSVKQVQSSSAVWASLRGSNINLDVSVCFFNPLPSDYRVEVESKDGNSEGELAWNAKGQKYDTLNVARMFGTTNESLSLEQRNLLQLKPPHNWNDAQAIHAYNVESYSAISLGLVRVNYDRDNSNGTRETTVFSENAKKKFSIHRTHVAIFQDILRRTGDLGMGLQTLFTIILQMA